MIRTHLWAAALALPTLTQEPDDFVGRWAGLFSTVDLEVEVNLAHEGGVWSGTVSIPAQGAQDLPLGNMAFDGESLVFAIDGVPGDPTFTSSLTDEGGLSGEFRQASFSATFQLERKTSRVPETLAALEELDPWLEKLMEDWEVPGLGLAIVRDDEVVLTSGYGLRDIAGGKPVTAETLFAIGSSSKAFTTTTLAILAGEGMFRWDDPLAELLPGLQLHDKHATAHLTPRDMASHQSGLPRHDLAWYGRTQFGLQEIFDSLRHYEPSAELREAWQYNNLMYVTLGHLAATLDGRSWEDAVRARILDPLGMSRTNFSVDDSKNDADHAVPYDEREGEITAIPMRDISHVGPAGSINSCAAEMAHWALLQLSDGTVGDVEVLSRSGLDEVHRPVVVMGGLPEEPEFAPALYGMGWMIDGYRGHLRVHHGGNIDGFSALVSFFPNDGLGVVVLTNRNATPVPEFVVRRIADLVFDHQPKDWSEKALVARAAAGEALTEGEATAEKSRVQGTAPSHAISAYTGSFQSPGYGPIDVRLEGDSLVLTLNGLKAVLEHWHYDVFRVDQSPDASNFEGTMMRYDTNLDGEISALLLPLEPTLPPLRFERAPDPELSDPGYLERFVGSYTLLGQRLTISISGEELSMAAPGQGIQLLEPLWNDTFSVSEANARISFTVVGDTATHLVIHQAGRTMSAEREDG